VIKQKIGGEKMNKKKVWQCKYCHGVEIEVEVEGKVVKKTVHNHDEHFLFDPQYAERLKAKQSKPRPTPPKREYDMSLGGLIYANLPPQMRSIPLRKLMERKHGVRTW
jgi:hypothetical protein